MTIRMLGLSTALVAAAWIAACGSSGGALDVSRVETDTRAEDFALADVNPASPTAGEDVSVRDHLGIVSVWYFGLAT